MVSRGNSRKHLGFVPSSINTALSPCRRQETGSAGFYHPQRLRFHFLIFLLTWSKASSAKQACLAQGGCTGKHFKGEQSEIRNWSADPSPQAGWSSPSPSSVPCRIQTVPVLASASLPWPHSLSPHPRPAGTLPSLLSQGNAPLGLPPAKLHLHPASPVTNSPKPPSTGEPSQAPGSCPLQLHRTLSAPSSTWHSDIPLKKFIPEYKTVALCQGTALGSGVPCHDPIFRAQALGQAHTLTLQQHEAVAVLEHQAGASKERAQLYQGKLTKQRCSRSTCPGFLEEELARRGSHVNLLYARGAQGEMRCLPHTPEVCAEMHVKLIYTQLKPSKLYPVDQIKVCL